MLLLLVEEGVLGLEEVWDEVGDGEKKQEEDGEGGEGEEGWKCYHGFRVLVGGVMWLVLCFE